MKFIMVILSTAFLFATSGQDVKMKTAKADEAAVEYTKEQKDDFVKEMEENIANVKKDIKDQNYHDPSDFQRLLWPVSNQNVTRDSARG